MNLKNKIVLLFVQTYQKRKEVPHMEMSRDNDRIRKESPYMEMSLDNYQKVCVYKEIELQNHSSTFIHNNKSPPSATTILCSSPMAYNTTAPLDKPTCSDYVHSGKCQDRFGQIPGSNMFPTTWM